MSELPRIRTPWQQQWRRIRYQLFPVLSLVACVFLTGWLWNRQVATVGLVGEAHVKVRNVVAGTTGTLVVLPQNKQFSLFDLVAKNQTVAQLDDRPVQAMLLSLSQELAQLKQELSTRQEELRQTNERQRHAPDAEARRLAWELEDLKLKVLDRKTQIEADRIEIQRQNAIYDSTKELAQRSAVSQRELLEVQLRRDVVAQRLRGNEIALTQAETQRDAAAKRLAELPASQKTPDEPALAPLHTRISELERRIKDLQAQIASLRLVSPIDGRVSALQHHPGEAVQPNDVIMTITDEQSQHIISYVRQTQKIRPQAGMKVQIRSRNDKGQLVSVDSEVESVGPAYAPIPIHHTQSRDPNAPDWGLPILIKMPPGLPDLRPGELVEVTLISRSSSSAKGLLGGF